MFYGAFENQQIQSAPSQIGILKCFKDFFFVSVCASVCNKHVGALEDQKRVLDPLELEIQVL